MPSVTIEEARPHNQSTHANVQKYGSTSLKLCVGKLIDVKSAIPEQLC
jgi:hypothetical protein